MIETERLILRPLSPQDEEAFIRGIADDELRRMYGFPAELSRETARRIFAHFSTIPAYGLIRKADTALVAFLLDVASELPDSMLPSLPESGCTLAFATFPPYQRQGYMWEALTALIEDHFTSRNTPYLHCGHFPFNESSRRLLHTLGFSEYGQHRFGKSVIIDEILFP